LVISRRAVIDSSWLTPDRTTRYADILT
jgi:hypothetical protein